MFAKNMLLILVLSVLASVSSGKHFELKSLPQAKSPMYDLSEVSGKMAYYDYVRNILGPKMQALAPQKRLDNEKELVAGNGVSVKLSANNYNVHINFPNAPTGGRSYGWTAGEVGDWSDAMYLDRLSEIVQSRNDRDLAVFFELVIKMVGASDANDLELLDIPSQMVANNFLAIYTAEAYRAMVPDGHKNWDDALLQVTLLGAFHGGQKDLSKFYLGEFTDRSRKQNSGVYAKYKPGPTADKAPYKRAELRDYWQFSADPNSKRSGVNITRLDFEKMGEAITRYERYVAKNPRLERIFTQIGDDRKTGQKNVIRAISKFFTTGQSKDPSRIPVLAQEISAFLMEVHADAEKITAWQERQRN